MYLVYIRPLFEYACEVWDNCGIDYSDKLENYLFKRKQQVINKNSWSSFELVSAGVPQGWVLGPSCF